MENDWDGEGRGKIGRCCFEAEAVAPGERKRKKMYVSDGDSEERGGGGQRDTRGGKRGIESRS